MDSQLFSVEGETATWGVRVQRPAKIIDLKGDIMTELEAENTPKPDRGLDRRQFLTTTGGVLASLRAWDRIADARPRAGQESSPEATEVVETPVCHLRVDRRNGNLIGLTWKEPSLEVIQEPRLGENFRILLPRPEYEANYFNSSDQAVSRIQKTANGVTCVYDNLRNAREALDVAVHYHIETVGQRLEFTIDIENPIDLPLAEIYFAIIGGQQGLADRRDTKSVVPGLNWNLAPSLFTKFRAGAYGGGNLGIRYDALAFTYSPPSPAAGKSYVFTLGACAPLK